MGTLTLTDAVTLTTIDSGTFNNNNAALRTVINGGLDNTNIASAAAIAISKLAMPGGLTFLRADGTFATPSLTRYVKETTTTVSNTTKTDLFGSGITIGAGAVSTHGGVYVMCGGTYAQASGSDRKIRLELKLGSDVCWDSDNSGALGTHANTRSWQMEFMIQQLNSISSQRAYGRFAMSDTDVPVTGNGTLKITSSSNGIGGPFIGAVTAQDMTTSKALQLNLTHNGASATMTCNAAIVLVV